MSSRTLMALITGLLLGLRHRATSPFRVGRWTLNIWLCLVAVAVVACVTLSCLVAVVVVRVGC
jgi:uncharacterized membrane protein